MEDYKQVVNQQSGQEGKEKEDEMGRYLLGSLLEVMRAYWEAA
ncbi:MAG: hypothetical protein AAFU83_03705 [Bacteroidota bacterium]